MKKEPEKTTQNIFSGLKSENTPYIVTFNYSIYLKSNAQKYEFKN